MDKLFVELEHCYGINKIKKEFDFSKCNTFVIYAPNGVMKTSFAKTFDDYSNKSESKDQVFGREPYKREVLDKNNANLDEDSIFVIKSYIDTSYTSDDLSLLLVRNELRESYEQVLKTLDEEKKNVVKVLAANTKSPDCEKEINHTFSDLGDNFFEILRVLTDEISGSKYRPYRFRYNHVFGNEVVRKFVEKNRDNLQVYHDKYFDILSNSDDFFSADGTFGTAQASEIAEAVSGDAFFKAGHSISLKNSDPVSSSEGFQTIINEQINKVVDSPELREQFDKIDKALRPKNMQPLRTIIDDDKTLLLELLNYEEFQKNYWKSHLSGILESVEPFNELYAKKRGEIEKIITEAENESEEWKNTISTFEKRFTSLPFKVKPVNTKDSVLGLDKPELGIEFIDQETGESKSMPRDFLSNNILSQGEKRAFYLLNIIFEIRARLLKDKETLFVIDDIADSFDYKNKYAIVEYLKDLSKEPKFYSIILTHNFDFYRTVQSRLLGFSNMKNCLIASRSSNVIELESIEKKGLINPFKNWKNKISGAESFGDDELKFVLASIPFVRNIIEYTKDEDSREFNILTHLLHVKEANIGRDIKSTDNLQYFDLTECFNLIFDEGTISLPEANVVESLYKIADSIAASDEGVMKLEDKVVLAMAIRLKAESHVLSKISLTSSIESNQTIELIEKYKSKFKTKAAYRDNIETLEEVNIMTPENIHLNSFMYEPILDMSICELKDLYGKVNNFK
jgi:ABC-type molybdenum transport system ATPase subunit/photorepair protein PhrA